MRSRSTAGARACATLRALCAKSAENDFAFAQDSFAEVARCRVGHVVPLDVFDFAAAIADEVVMAHSFGVVTRGAAFDGDFTDETRLHQIAKIVVGGGSRRARIDAIDGLEGFSRRWVAVLFHQESHHRVTLRSATQAFFLERAFDLDLVSGH
jgi:hypothetical protein